jgi:DNA-binding transcriptional LysR family regulator
MLDAVSLDQLRTYIAAVDKGSFSAASRKLLRSQSVVSETIGNLEEQIGVQLFDRSGRYPKLTPAGLAILGDARSIITGVDLLKARAKGMSVGLEPELSVAILTFAPVVAAINSLFSLRFWSYSGPDRLQICARQQQPAAGRSAAGSVR